MRLPRCIDRHVSICVRARAVADQRAEQPRGFRGWRTREHDRLASKPNRTTAYEQVVLRVQRHVLEQARAELLDRVRHVLRTQLRTTGRHNAVAFALQI